MIINGNFGGVLGGKLVKVWLESEADIEDGAKKQIVNLSRLPFLFKQVAIMPDVHSGYGMPIGGVIATHGVIIPNAVGVDIGCGMAFTMTDTDTDIIDNEKKTVIVKAIMKNIPVGFAHRQTDGIMSAELLDKREYLMLKNHPILNNACFPADLKQVGTLGGGNHFIELQRDEATGKLAVMLHSGSRNVGKQVCDYFNKLAKEINRRYFSSVPAEYDLAFLPVDSQEGGDYIQYMDYCLAFAKQNRENMMNEITAILYACGVLGNQTMSLNVHHNYASLENHFGQNVWVHRKGAVRARAGEVVIIPGSMGSYSYIAEGLGSLESFQSCSHGAGRTMSRKKAKLTVSRAEVEAELQNKGIVIGKQNMADVAEESRQAYKDIDTVINNERDLIEPLMKLKTIAVIKG
jgi:tRNA-splicing ligase RtcB